jgi:hypothetical protein
MTNYYTLLKVKPEVSHEELELAFVEFKKELLKFSPGIDLSEAELRSRKPDIWNAYEFLLNPTFRKEYDEALERERIHTLYETQNKIREEQEVKSSIKRKYVGLGAIIAIMGIYFLQDLFSTNSIPQEPNWRMHYITDEMKILLPAAIDSSINIIPPFMMHYIDRKLCFKSELKGGFAVTVAQFTMSPRFKISEKDVSYIVNTDMGSHMAIIHPDSSTYNLNIHGYRAFIRKGTYGLDGGLHAFENYSLVNGTSAIKVIISYIPGNEMQSKYAEIVFNSLAAD